MFTQSRLIETSDEKQQKTNATVYMERPLVVENLNRVASHYCCQADTSISISISNMAAASNAEHTQLQDMEEEGAEMEEREMEEDEEQEEDGMAEEEEEEEEEDSSEDEKENEAEIQRLEEQVTAFSFSSRANDNEWMHGWKHRHYETTSAWFKM